MEWLFALVHGIVSLKFGISVDFINNSLHYLTLTTVNIIIGFVLCLLSYFPFYLKPKNLINVKNEALFVLGSPKN